MSDAFRITEDTFLNGRLQVRQERGGYRFSIDAVLLAHQAVQYPGPVVLDLGTGCGIIPLILASRNPSFRIFGVEIQESLAALAAANVAANGMADRITIIRGDMKTLNRPETGGPVDMVVANPPYRRVASGRMNPDRQRAIARHEIKATVNDAVQTARRMLDISGRFLTVYPAERLTELLGRMTDGGIEPKRLRTVHSRRDTAARLVLVEGNKGGRPGMTVAPPLIIYRENGDYTGEVARMFTP